MTPPRKRMPPILWHAGVLLVASAAVYGVQNPPYTLVSQFPSIVDDEGLANFAFDPVARRLYAQSREGVYWVDTRDAKPTLQGPILPKQTISIEVVPDIGRLYFSSLIGYGYLNLRSNDPPKTVVGQEWRGGRIVYEPTRKEMYTVAHQRRGAPISVHAAETGEHLQDIQIPGWSVSSLEAVPGKVFFSVQDKPGLYVIDATTHVVTPWPVTGKLVTPASLEGDPSGQYLFAHYGYDVVAIDIRTSTVVGRLKSAGDTTFAFDPESRLIIVAARDFPDHPRMRLRAYSVGANGFTPVAELKNLSEDETDVRSMAGGFLQRGRHAFYLWTAAPTR
jgi:hypothetical protein